MKTLVALMAVVTVLAWSAAAYGQMYKWVDKNGRTHYTDTPPPPDAKSSAPPPGSRAPDAPAKAGDA